MLTTTNSIFFIHSACFLALINLITIHNRNKLSSCLFNYGTYLSLMVPISSPVITRITLILAITAITIVNALPFFATSVDLMLAIPLYLFLTFLYPLLLIHQHCCFNKKQNSPIGFSDIDLEKFSALKVKIPPYKKKL